MKRSSVSGFTGDNLRIVYMKVVGGEVTSAAALAPKCGPLGMPPKKVGEDIQKATTEWRGIKIQIEMMVQNRQCFITVLPTAAPLVIKALKEGPRDRKKQKNVKHNGNLKFDDIIDIAKKLRPKSMAVESAGTVKEVLGTCISLGCTVDGKSPKEITTLINNGEIDVPKF
jgi:large subunit ribosomal protein L12e